MAAGIRSMGFLVKQIMLLLQQLMDGYRFSPTEEELINYLKLEEPEPGFREGFCIIPKIENIYKINPSALRAKFSEESIIPSKDREWWFICPQKQNERISRKTPCGSWKITGKPKDVVIDGKKEGSRTTLVFTDDQGPKGGKSDWVIHEYRLPKDHSNIDYVLCHVMDKQFGKADNSTTTSEHGVIDLAELKSILDQPDDDVSFPKKLVQARMDAPMEPQRHQNQIQFSLPDVLHLFKWWLRPQSNRFPSNIHQFTNFGSPSFEDFSLDNSLTDRSIELGSSLRTTKEDKRFDLMPNAGLVPEVQKGEEPRLEKVQQETAVRNIKPCISLDEEAAREKHKQDGEAANSTTKSEDGATDLAELQSLLNQPDDEGSFSERLIEEKMKSLAGPSQHQKQVQFSVPDPLQLRSQNNSVPSTIHQFPNIGSPPVDDFSSDNPLESFLKVEDARLEKVQLETAARAKVKAAAKLSRCVLLLFFIDIWLFCIKALHKINRIIGNNWGTIWIS